MLSACRKRYLYLTVRGRRRNSSSSIDAAILAALNVEDFSLVLREIKLLCGSSKLKEASVLSRRVPPQPLLLAAINEFKVDYPSSQIIRNEGHDESKYCNGNVIPTILDSLLSAGSEDVKYAIDLAKSDVVAANLIGAQRLLCFCNFLYNSTHLKLSGSAERRADEHSDTAVTSTSQWQKPCIAQSSPSFHLDDRVHSRSASRRSSLLAEQEFVKSFNPWLLRMNPSARWYHVDMVIADVSYKITKTSDIRLMKGQVLHLHEELNFLKLSGYNVDPTSIGDVAMAAFSSFKLIGKIDKSVQLLNELIRLGELQAIITATKLEFHEAPWCNCYALCCSYLIESALDIRLVTRDSFSRAVSNCLIDSKKKSSCLNIVKISKVGEATSANCPVRVTLQALYKFAGGNSSHAIEMRGDMAQIILSSSRPELAAEFVRKADEDGLIVGTRSFNCMISSYARTKHLALALEVLNKLDREKHKILGQSMKVAQLSTDLFRAVRKPLSSSSSSSSSSSALHPLTQINPSGSGQKSNTRKSSRVSRDLNDSYYPPPVAHTGHPSFGSNLTTFNELVECLSTLSTRPPPSPLSTDKVSVKADDHSPIHEAAIESVSPHQASQVAHSLLDRMESVGLVPGLKIITHTMEIGRASGDIRLLLRGVTSALNNSSVPSLLDPTQSALVAMQPHTHLESKDDTKLAAWRAAQRRHSADRLNQEGSRGLFKWVPDIGKVPSSFLLAIVDVDPLRGLAPLSTLTKDRDREKVRERDRVKDNTLRADPFSGCMDVPIITMADMAQIYHVAVDTALLTANTELLGLLIDSFVQAGIPPCRETTRAIMRYYYEEGEYREVMRTFELIPKWHGERDEVHGSILVEAMVKRGSLSDAWEGLKISEQTSPLLPSAYRALLDRAVLTLINMTDAEGDSIATTTSSSSAPYTSSSSSSFAARKRMSKSQTEEAIAFCLYGLIAKSQSALSSSAAKGVEKNESLESVSPGSTSSLMSVSRSMGSRNFSRILELLEHRASEEQMSCVVMACAQLRTLSKDLGCTDRSGITIGDDTATVPQDNSNSNRGASSLTEGAIVAVSVGRGSD